MVPSAKPEAVTEIDACTDIGVFIDVTTEPLLMIEAVSQKRSDAEPKYESREDRQKFLHSPSLSAGANGSLMQIVAGVARMRRSAAR